jgi:cytochrome c oxidase subunit II
MRWWLPDAGSTFAKPIDALFLAILIITGIALVLVEVGLVTFVIKYRARPGRKAFWTAIPAVTMVALGLISNHYWVLMKDKRSIPPNAYHLGVHAKQFEWQVTYPGPDGKLGTADDFTVRNQLHVTVNQPIAVELTSEDAIHSFFVPEWRVKQDAVPGMQITAWFEATKTGEFEIGCAELCGMGHYRMRARVFVHTPEEYKAWVAQQIAGGTE